MSIQKNDRVIIKDLAWEIAQSQADSHSERWQEADGDDSMRRTIVSAMNQHGWSPDGVPGVLPHIYRMLEAGEISAQSTFNGMPPANVSEIEVNPANWYVTRQDADKVKALLLATARQPIDEQTVAQDASLSPVKKGALLRELQKQYPGLANALQANDPGFCACRVHFASAPGNKRGYYYREKVVAVCEARWGRSTTPTRPSSVELNSLGAQLRGIRDGKKFS